MSIVLGKTSLEHGVSMLEAGDTHEAFSKLVETLAIPFSAGECLVVFSTFDLAYLHTVRQFG